MPSSPKIFQIGATYAGLANVSTLYETLRDRDPNAKPIGYLSHIEVGDRTRIAQGLPQQVWHWDILSEAMWATLVGYANTTKYVRTRKNDGTFGVFTCIIILPEEEPEHFAGRVLDVDFTLRDMIAYTES